VNGSISEVVTVLDDELFQRQKSSDDVAGQIREEVLYIKHIQDEAWEDGSAPDLKGIEKMNYLRMRYLVAQMLKMRERQIRKLQINDH
jgi:protein tyrosine phosphatase